MKNDQLKKAMPTVGKYLGNKWVIALFIFIILVSVYGLTVSPTVTAEDSGEFIIAAYDLGILHPSGYPIYSIIGKVFSSIPIGEVGWRVNMMSAFFGALACSLLYVFTQNTIKSKFKRPVGITIALLLGFAATIWEQALIAEVYTLNLFFTILGLLLISFWVKTKKNHWLYLFALGYGLSLTNHLYLMLAMAPLYALYILLYNWQIIKKWKVILIMALLFIIGLTPYLFLPIRSGQDPFLDWGNTESWENFMYHVERKQYGGSQLGQDMGNQEIMAARFAHLKDYFKDRLPEQFSLGLLLPALFGLYWLYRKDKKMFLIMLGIFIMYSLIFILLRGNKYNDLSHHLKRVFYLQGYIAMAYYIGYGFLGVLELLQKELRKWPWTKLAYVILIFPILVLWMNYANADHSQFYYSYDQARNNFLSVEENAIIIFKSDNMVRNVWYLQQVEGFRSDVSLIQYFTLFSPVNLEAMRERYPDMMEWDKLPESDQDIKPNQLIPYYINWFANKDQPVYIEGSSKDIPKPYFYQVALAGTLYRILPGASEEEVMQYTKDYGDDLNAWEYNGYYDPNFYQNDFFVKEIVHNNKIGLYYSGIAHAYFGEYEKALEYLQRANKYFSIEGADELIGQDIFLLQNIIANPEDPNAYYNYALQRANRVDNQEMFLARKMFEKTLELDPNNTEARFGLGFMLQKLERFDEAMEQYKIVAEQKPELLDVHVSMGQLYAQVYGDYDNAVASLEKAVELNPNDPNTHLYLAQVFELKGDKEALKNEIGEILKLDPQNAAALRFIEDNPDMDPR
ncbi:DUF2723 domain-containing protein [Patescibacteria group bacterium]|nr:DUF2723 domain-containing protein [Patescibacteria group bacterium]MBU1672997.1 DUF2723 domain-containing protein [Patescibacteria group bacterium]MBU1962968.1 DUF2723 domain-containing protein [Patescibacteria group bacterium]